MCLKPRPSCTLGRLIGRHAIFAPVRLCQRLAANRTMQFSLFSRGCLQGAEIRHSPFCILVVDKRRRRAAPPALLNAGSALGWRDLKLKTTSINCEISNYYITDVRPPSLQIKTTLTRLLRRPRRPHRTHQRRPRQTPSRRRPWPHPRPLPGRRHHRRRRHGVNHYPHAPLRVIAALAPGNRRALRLRHALVHARLRGTPLRLRAYRRGDDDSVVPRLLFCV